jgi:ABC-type branched-subunit amino acid transport system permease subunit
LHRKNQADPARGNVSSDFRFSESILTLAMIVVGGLGSVPDAVVGAAHR